MFDKIQNLIHAAILDVNDALWGYCVIYCLIGAGLYFTLRTLLVQLRLLPEMLRLLVERPQSEHKHHISSFQAFCVSTASRVGVGNIAGVATAIALGGPGAIFWMWVIAFLGAATCFAECTLGQIYKIHHTDGSFHGGPAYYIQNALGFPIMAKVFAILISITFGLIYVSVQANTMVISVETAFGIKNDITCAIVFILSGLVIFGGMKRIAKVSEMMVPFMAMLYLLIALVVAVMHWREIPEMFSLICTEAFKPRAYISGGLTSVLLLGIKRGLFSNEAGQGSIPNAAATAAVSHPVKQGLLQGFGVYLDTWVVCTATAVIILLGGNWIQDDPDNVVKGIKLAQLSLANTFGGWAPWLISVMVLFFAFSSIVGNYCYAEVNITFFGGMVKRNLVIFRILLLGMIVWGSYADLDLIWDSADLFMGLLCMVNLVAIIILSPQVFAALKDYTNRIKEGKRDTPFDASVLSRQKGVEVWKRSVKN